jgi:tetratricopeptide (TPR) repeat protein
MKSTQANRIVGLWLAIAAVSSAAGSAAESGQGEDIRPRVRALVQKALKSFGDETGTDLAGSRAVVRCAVLLAQLGDAEAARQTLRQVRDRIQVPAGEQTPMGRDQEWLDLATGYAEIGDAEELRAVLAALPAPSGMNFGGSRETFHAVVLVGCARALAKAGKGKDALELAGGVRAPYTPERVRLTVLQEIALASARTGDFKEARRALEAIPEPEAKIRTLVGLVSPSSFELLSEPGIAILQDEAGDHDGARQSMKQALEIAQGIKDTEMQARGRATIVCAQAGVRDLTGALQTLEQVPAKSRDYRSAVAAVARAQAAAGQGKAALEAVAKLEAPEPRAYALSQVIMGQAQAGDLKGARATGEKALELILTLPQRQRGSPVHILANARAMAKDFKGALETASQRPVAAQTTYSVIAYWQAREGDMEGAERTLKAQSRKGSLSRELQMLGRVQAAQGREKEALAWAELRGTTADYGYALLGIAEGLVERHKLVSRRR